MNKNINNIKIGFCGLSHLGLCYSSVAAEKKFNVICFDHNKKKIEELKKLYLDINEPKLKNLIEKNKKNIYFTNDILKLSKCDFVYFSYDVKTNELGKSDIEDLKIKLEHLINNLRKKTPIIILSQIFPGFARKYYKIKNNLYYQVETLVFGNAISKASNPERFIIGSYSAKDILPIKFKKFLDAFKCPVLVMKYESAELAKIAINCYLASSITITNTLAEVSSAIDANWNEIIPALHLDNRIGKFAYLNPGLGISGGNIERDLFTLMNIGNKKYANMEMIKNILDISKYSKEWLLRKINYYLKKDSHIKVSILGLAYKKNTNSIKNSPAIHLIKSINNNEIKVYDPLVKNINIDHVKVASSAYNAIEGTSILVIATPWSKFKKLNLNIIKSKMCGNIILDPYKVLKKDLVEKLGFQYYFLG